ncbi:MAG: reverse transcriptase N-terminal domain-containing protein [Spirochaetes bacterium]|nr:reverse transcriptase N-terminal domain-containing protein [Spirochaetota bacterium]
MSIAKAVKEKDYGKARSLQWILTHSFCARAVAMKRVTSNKGKNTPGNDGVLWKTAKAKMQAVHSLRQHGYRAELLRRIHIPKKNGKKRPLSIPIMIIICYIQRADCLHGSSVFHCAISYLAQKCTLLQ